MNEKLLNEENQILNFIRSLWELLWFRFIYYGFGTVITVPVPLRSVIKLRFLFPYGKKGSGSAKLPSMLLLYLNPRSRSVRKYERTKTSLGIIEPLFSSMGRGELWTGARIRGHLLRGGLKNSPQSGAINHFLPTTGKTFRRRQKKTRSPTPT